MTRTAASDRATGRRAATGRAGGGRGGDRLGDRGGGGIEMAIILPLLLTSVFAISHMAMYHLARQAALSVAQVAVEGERSWLAEPGAGHARADDFYDGLPAVLGGMNVTIANDGEHVTATVTGDPISVIPWFPYTVTQTASAPVERIT